MPEADGEYERQGTGLPEARRGQSIIDYVLAGSSLITVGASELIAPAIRKVVEKRIETLRDALLQDLQSGLIDQDAVIKEDDLASFIIRLQRAAMEGCGSRKLSLMIKYFFRSASEADYREDMFLTFAGVTEQLSNDELKCLAVIKAALIAGALPLQSDEGETPTRRIKRGIDLLGLFPSHDEFVSAVKSLVRFGFVDFSSGWGALVIEVTDRACDYLEKIEIET